jgi:hypothetical protein
MITIGDIRKQARKDAAEVLERFWPSRYIPVKPIMIARQLGLSVFSAGLPEDVWGQLSHTASGFEIYLPMAMPYNRYAVCCAHEIGHFLDREDVIHVGKAVLDRRSTENASRADEVYAIEFASYLLIPEYEDPVLESMEDLDAVKRYVVPLSEIRIRKRRLSPQPAD